MIYQWSVMDFTIVIARTKVNAFPMVNHGSKAFTCVRLNPWYCNGLTMLLQGISLCQITMQLQC
jgi:hypothetical protein